MLARALRTYEQTGRRRPLRPAHWHLSHRVAIGLVVATLAGALVITDLPTRATPTYQSATLRGYLSTLRGDVAPCEAGVHDALQAAVATFEREPGIQPGVAATFTAQGVAACSFTNSSTVDLAGMAPPHSLTATPVERVAPALGTLVYSDAFQLLQDLAYVLHRPGATRWRTQFQVALDHYEDQRTRIAGLVAAAGRAEAVPHASLPLFSPRGMLPDGRLPAAVRP